MTPACPRCTNPLVGRRIEDVVVHECSDCSGVFLDQNAIGLVVQDEGYTRAQAIVAALPRAPISAVRADGPMYVKCPTCSTVMNRKQFAAGAKVVVDVCKDHGTFFDAGELPAIIDYVMSGELEKARARRTVDRVPLDKQPDTFAKQLALARRDRGSNASVAEVADVGAALVDVIFDLFT